MAVESARPTGNTLTGIALLLTGLSLVPAMDAMAKYLSAWHSAGQLAWARYVFHFLALAPLIVWLYGWGGFRPNRLGLQIVRAGVLMIATLAFFTALSGMPLADAIAIVFVAPLIVTALAPIVLKERVGARRWAAVAAGFVGALIIVRPGGEGFTVYALYALAAAVCYAVFLTQTRLLAGASPPLVTLMFTSVVGTAVLSLWVPFDWVTPQPVHWPMLVVLGIISAVAHFCIIKAYEMAEAPVLAPFQYFELIVATALGIVVFGDFPDIWTWVGAAVVAAAGIYVAWRENRIARAAISVRARPR